MAPRAVVLALLIIVAACGDTTDTTATTDPGGAASGMVVDGGLTVPEAIATDATGILAVRGNLFFDEQGWRLCEALAESFPPQCGGAALPLGNVDEATIAGLLAPDGIALSENQGIRWTDQQVILFADLVDGTLEVNPQATG